MMDTYTKETFQSFSETIDRAAQQGAIERSKYGAITEPTLPPRLKGFWAEILKDEEVVGDRYCYSSLNYHFYGFDAENHQILLVEVDADVDHRSRFTQSDIVKTVYLCGFNDDGEPVAWRWTPTNVVTRAANARPQDPTYAVRRARDWSIKNPKKVELVTAEPLAQEDAGLIYGQSSEPITEVHEYEDGVMGAPIPLDQFDGMDAVEDAIMKHGEIVTVDIAPDQRIGNKPGLSFKYQRLDMTPHLANHEKALMDRTVDPVAGRVRIDVERHDARHVLTRGIDGSEWTLHHDTNFGTVDDLRQDLDFFVGFSRWAVTHETLDPQENAA